MTEPGGGLLFKGHSSRLQLLIEKIQANKENHNVTEQDLKDALGPEGVPSWAGSEGHSSPPSSCATPNSATELADSELAFTVGVTEGTPYACQFCDKAFPRLSYLKKHEQTHSDQLPFICEFCKRRFKHKRSKDRHLKLHTGDKRYKCAQCQAAFARSDHLKIHMKTHDNQKPFQCTVCNRGYNTAAALTSHMQNHKKSSEPDSTPSGSTFKCLECSEVFSKPELLTNHAMTEHDGTNNKRRASPNWNKISCMYCTKDNFSTLEALQLHIQAMHGSSIKGSHRYDFSKAYLSNGSPSTGFACRLCTMVFPTSATLQAHASSAHGINEDVSLHGDKHQCPQCSLNFKSLKSFAEHFVQNHGIPSPVLGKPTKPSPDQIHPTDLTVVRKEHSDKPPAVKRSRGLTVQVELPQKTTLQHSMMQYDHPGILLCNQCNAALPDFESFRSHLKSHLEESSFSPGPPTPLTSRLPQLNICTYCGAHLPSTEDLTRHVGSHFLSTVTEYGCQSCYQLFQKTEDLQKHLLENHAQCWYRCTLCKELFESQSAIQVHFAVKHCTETKQYRCAACPNTAFLHSELEFSLHVQAVHCPLNVPTNPSVISPPRVHRCIFCNLSFNSEIEMHFHLAVHTKLFRCPVCSESFHVEYFLEKHIQMCHPNQEKIARLGSFEEEANGNDRTRNGLHPPKSSGFSSVTNITSTAGSETGKKPEPSNNATIGCNNNNTHQLKLNNNNNNSIGACDICEGGEFATEAELDVHRKLVHHLKTSNSTKVSLHCAYCKESCKSRTELENHMKSFCQAAIGSNKHKCNICDELCISTAALAEHKLTHCKVVHGSKCTNCKTLITNEECFISHSIQHSNLNSGTGQQLVFPYPCVICRQTLSSEMETRLHAKFHLQAEVVQCSNCHQSQDRLEIIEGICKMCHSRTRSSPCVCMHCHIHFESSTVLELHMTKNHQQSFKCSKCKECFESEKEFEAHSAQVCNADNVYKCCLCLLLFPGPTQLQTHLIEHTFMGCSNFTCYICSAVFTTAHALQNHIVEHGLMARPYDCTKCSQKFFFRAELENHLFVHIENPYLSLDQVNKNNFTETSHFNCDSEEVNKGGRKAEVHLSQNGLNLVKHGSLLHMPSSSEQVNNNGGDSYVGAISNGTGTVKVENGFQETKPPQLASTNEAECFNSMNVKIEKE